MIKAELGTVLFETSFFGLGTASFRPLHNFRDDEKKYLNVLSTAVDYGCSHLDTAAAYANGFSETVIGKFLKRKPHVKEKLVIASKGGMKGTTANFLKVINTSRRRLNCDVIDIFYIHWPVEGVDPRYSLDALAEAKYQGLIRYAGLSNFSLRELKRALEHMPVDVCQIAYNMIWREAEKMMIPFCRNRGIACTGYAPLAQGILTDIQKPASSLHENDHRRLTLFYSSEYSDCRAEIISRFQKAVAETGVSLVRAARQWLKSHGQVDAAVIGASTREQAEENFSFQADLPETVLKIFEKAAEKAADCFTGQESIYLSRP